MQVCTSNNFSSLSGYSRGWGALFAFCWKIFGSSRSWMGSLSDFSESFTSLKVVSFSDLHCKCPISPTQDLSFTYQCSLVFHDRKVYFRCYEIIISLKKQRYFSILVEERKSMKWDMLIVMKTFIDHHS